MIKEIGSIFSINKISVEGNSEKLSTFAQDKVLFSLCREALREIAVLNEGCNKTVLIPAYTCQTVITPFDECGWKTKFYPITKDLRIDINILMDLFEVVQPSLLVVHPYYGMDLNEEEENALSSLRSKGLKIVIDLTQCIFSRKSYSFCDYRVGSYRKWFPMPDGAFLDCYESVKLSAEPNSVFSDLYSWAMYLRNLYFTTGDTNLKSISIALSKNAENIVDKGISPHDISELSLKILSEQDIESNQKQRLRNHAALHSLIKDRNGIAKVCQNEEALTTAPLYFPLYINHRSELQKRLAEHSIYAPVLWPVENEDVLINTDIRYIYSHILAIPCDQRYDTEDMHKIATIINNFNNEE